MKADTDTYKKIHYFIGNYGMNISDINKQWHI